MAIEAFRGVLGKLMQLVDCYSTRREVGDEAKQTLRDRISYPSWWLQYLLKCSI